MSTSINVLPVIFLLVSLLWGCVSGNGATAATTKTWVDSKSPQALKVLFIGNSITYVNELPLMLYCLLDAQQPGIELKISEAVGPGWSLQDHWNDGEALKMIKQQGPWQYVVLQDQTMKPIRDLAGCAYYTKLFDEEIKRAGARTLLFETYVDDAESNQQPAISQAYSEMASQLGDQIIPVGTAWRAVRGRLPDVKLYADDAHHPALSGTYLMSLVLSAKLLNKNPENAPAKLSIFDTDSKKMVTYVEVPAQTARQLQFYAWDAVCRRH